jgi:hypothetical protein
MSYWERLKDHPGVGYALMFTFMGGMAGLMREDAGFAEFLVGSGLMALHTWVPVLWTNMERKP